MDTDAGRAGATAVSKVGYTALKFGWCRRPQRRPGRDGCCVAIKVPPERPDPASYSQEERLAQGLIPTWNSPDITTNAWSPFRLRPEADVRVRNLSSTASAVNVLVHFATSAFGIGMQPTPMSTLVVALAPLQETVLHFPFPQAILAGPPTIGTYTVIEHPSDANVANNRGAQVHHGLLTSESGRIHTFQVPVLNLSAAPRTLTLSVLPNDLGAAVTPNVRNFAPWEQIQASVTFQVPGTLHGAPGAWVEKEVTVVGRGPGGGVIGGVTYVVRVDD
jgi:hypothetical protein